ncbi:hypothetical protein HBI08_215190 [Parastagonospora nodorum]|nr:hypothetical protein HBI08_215190 [Parastagonospora nodorum]
MLILILSLLNDAEVLLPANANVGVMLRNKSNEYKGLVNKDLKLLKQKILAGYSICNAITLISDEYETLYAEVKREIRE